MTTREAVELAGRILAEAVDKVQAKPGATNGEGRVHLAYAGKSTTLKSVAEWDEHPLNRKNAPRKPRRKKDPHANEADAATIQEALASVYEPEDY